MWIPVDGIAVRLMDDVSYREQSLILEPGDAVPFCSDGFDEAMDGAGRLFSTDHL